jgi:hypothetical protein
LKLTIWSPSRTSFEMPTLKRKERYTASQWRSRSFQKSYKCADLPNKIDSLLASLFQQEQPFVDPSIQNEYHGQRLLRHKLVVCTKWQSVSLRGSYQTVDLSRWMDWFIYRIQILL